MRLPIELGTRSYEVILERGGLLRAGEYLDLDRRVLVLTDDGVPATYAQRVANAARDGRILTLPQGERSKSVEGYTRVLSALAEGTFTRRDCIVAVGGGVCGDLAGFAAATYMRGIDFYNIPTTMLAMVDSSIGGKTGINFGGVKNLVGAFWQPRGVLIDPDVLQTLDPRLFAEGLAEVIKMAATSDAKLFELLETEPFEEHLEEIILGGLKIKKSVVEQDETESGIRKILNFGHTIGHGIESAETPARYHGECVSLGMLPMCEGEAGTRLQNLLCKAGLPTTCEPDWDKVFEAVAHDKKGTAQGLDAVLVKKIGTCEIRRMRTDELRARATNYFGKSKEK